MKKPIIAIDIDEVLYPNVDALLPYFNRVSGTSVTKEQMQTYYIEDVTGETTESVLQKISDHVSSNEYDEDQLVDQVVDSIKKLADKYGLMVVTARHGFWRGHTEKFLEKHFPGLFAGLHYSRTVEDTINEKSKHEICKEIGAEYLIDDSLSNVAKCSENGIKGILFGDYPWNQADKLPEGVIRCKDWPAVLDYFLGVY